MIRAVLRVLVFAIPVLYAVPAAAERPLDSHEYKSLLTASFFAGNPSGKTVNDVWQEKIKQRLMTVRGLTVSGMAFSLDKTRRVRFRDTAKNGRCYLLANGFILRERAKLVNGKAKKPKATLKFRHPDRATAAAIDFKASDRKFEEDVSRTVSGPPWIKRVYSVSGKVKLKGRKAGSLGKVKMLFPGFEEALAGVRDRDDKLETVSGLTITEYVFEGPILNLGGVEAATKVSLWYDGKVRNAREPLLAEFSFGYDRYGHSSTTLETADALAVGALEKLVPLMKTAGQARSKTRFVYQHEAFCARSS